MRFAWLFLLALAAFFPGSGAWVRSGLAEGADRTSSSPPGRIYLGKVVVAGRLPARKVQSQPGLPVNEDAARALAARITAELQREGYADARVNSRLVGSGYRRADIHLEVDAGERYTLAAPEFAGPAGVPAAQLRRVLHRRFRRPPYSREAVEANVVRLRSFFTARGYLQARVEAAAERRKGTHVTVPYTVDAGPRSLLAGDQSRQACRVLLNARAQAGREGRIDFRPLLRAVPTTSGQLRFESESTAGEPWFVTRIAFSGHHRCSDLTLRRALVLEEGAAFDPSRLARSLVRLSRLGLLEPLSEQNVRVTGDAATRTVRLDITVQEVKFGRWSLAGPLGSPALGGSLHASLSARLPATTYLASVSWVAFNRAWPRPAIPYVALQRPLLVGQTWLSGFTLSPQIGLKTSAVLYGLTQARGRLQDLLRGGHTPEASLVVPVERGAGGQTAVLICEDRRSRWTLARAAAAAATELLLSWPF